MPEQIAEGLAAVEEAINHSENTEERWMICRDVAPQRRSFFCCGVDRLRLEASAEDRLRQARLDWAGAAGRALLGTARAAHGPFQSLLRDQNAVLPMPTLFSLLSSPGLPKGSRRLTSKHRRRFRRIFADSQARLALYPTGAAAWRPKRSAFVTFTERQILPRPGATRRNSGLWMAKVEGVGLFTVWLLRQAGNSIISGTITHLPAAVSASMNFRYKGPAAGLP